MLSAFLEDAVQVGGRDTLPLQCLSLLGSEPPSPLPAEIDIYYSAHPRQAHEQLLALSAAADLTLIIAPETEGILLQQFDYIQSAGSQWLGPDRPTLEICSDKFQLAQLWNRLALPTPATELLANYVESNKDQKFPLVLKPRDGAGGDQTWRIESPDEFQRFLEYTTPEEQQLYLVQPFIEGVACSISILSLNETDHFFPPGEQRIDWENGFHYHGGTLPLKMPTETIALLHESIQTIRSSLPGLSGYWGLDFVWNPESIDQPVTLIEINPRLTTSYLGYRQLTSLNLAELWLNDAGLIGQETGTIPWQTEPVSF
ncbi:MAG: ATP-grasp domain-containing protein [Planctomycetaceae bacterium]|nr:ATP-grasp domain-containing protein [Planctomycetaceae bacterium]